MVSRKISTYMALLKKLDRVSDALDMKNTTIGVNIDLFQAFDTVNHSILLSKLHHHGIRIYCFLFVHKLIK